jgi:cation transport ATPase
MATQQMTVQINGMTCAGCVARIEQTLRQEEGVIWANINFAAGQATVTYEPHGFDLARLSRAIHALGYQLEPTPSSAPAATAHSPAAYLWHIAPSGALALLALIGLFLGFTVLGQGRQEAAELLWAHGWLAAVVIACSALFIASRFLRGKTRL